MGPIMANDPNDPAMATEENKPTVWISIPSIPAHRVGQGLLAFLLAIAVVTAIDVLLITHNHRPATWPLAAEMVFDDGSSIVAWSLPLTWPLMEAIRMVLAGIWEKRNRRRHIAEGKTIGLAEGKDLGREEGIEEGKTIGREEGIEEGKDIGREEGFERGKGVGRVEGFDQGRGVGRVEGLDEAHNAWRDWLQRKEAAEISGVPFNEPAPGNNGHRNGSRSSPE